MTPEVTAEAARRHLWPNVGGEERDPRRFAAIPQVSSTRRLWGGLFDRATRAIEADYAPDWAEVAAMHAAPALAPLTGTHGLVPWLVTREAEAAARGARVPVFGPPADVVRRVHDKAFATDHAHTAGLVPAGIRGMTRAFEPDEIEDLGRWLAASTQTAKAWGLPGPGAGFWPKLRISTSGRGRIDPEAYARSQGDAAERNRQIVRESGGIIIEPILERVTDLSVVLWVSGPDGAPGAVPITVIAALRQIVTRGGTWRGHRGEIDRRGRIYSGTSDDDAMREAAASIAEAARAEGFFGPCGIDGFTFSPPGDRSGTPVLRPLVELNARFTLGHVCAGWLRRALSWLAEERGLEPGRRIGFVFALAPPPGCDDWAQALGNFEGDVLPLPFATPTPLACPGVGAEPGAGRGPALVLHPDPGRLDALAEALGRAPPLRSGGASGS